MTTVPDTPILFEGECRACERVVRRTLPPSEAGASQWIRVRCAECRRPTVATTGVGPS